LSAAKTQQNGTTADSPIKTLVSIKTPFASSVNIRMKTATIKAGSAKRLYRQATALVPQAKAVCFPNSSTDATTKENPKSR
jgi:hypothetical protein